MGKVDDTYKYRWSRSSADSPFNQELKMGSLEDGESAIRVDDGLVSSAHLSVLVLT